MRQRPRLDTAQRRHTFAVYLVTAAILVGMNAWFASGRHWLSVVLVAVAAVVVGWGFGTQLVSWQRQDAEQAQWAEICRQIRQRRDDGPHDAA